MTEEAETFDPASWVPVVPPRDPAAMGPAGVPPDTYVPLDAPPADNRLEIEKPFWERSWNSVRNIFTGEDRTGRPGIPELPDVLHGTIPTRANARVELGYLASSTPEQLKGVIQSAYPEAKFSEDTYGNPMVRIGDQLAYLNKPGLSGADLLQTLGIAAPAVLAATGVGAIPGMAGRGVINTLARAGAQGVGQAGVSVGRDLGAMAAGSTEGVDPVRAMEAGVFGAAGEPLAAGLGIAGRTVADVATRRWGAAQYLTPAAAAMPPETRLTADMLNATGRDTLTAARMPAERLTVGDMLAVQRIASTRGAAAAMAEDSDQGRRLARNTVLSARFEYPMTVGQLTGDPLRLGREDALRHVTSAAKPVMSELTDRQIAANQTATGRLQTGGAAPPANRETLGSAINQGVTDTGQRLEADANQAWQAPGLRNQTALSMAMAPASEQAWFPPAVSRSILDRMQDTSRQPLSDAGQAAQRRIGQLISSPSEGFNPGEEAHVAMRAPGSLVQLAPFNVGAVRETLYDLDGLYGQAASDQDRRAIARMRTILRSSLDDPAALAQVRGNPQVAADYFAANAAVRRQHLFDDPDIDTSPAARQFMGRMFQGNVTGEETIKALYGGSLGGKNGTMQILEHLSNEMEGTPAWAAMREAAIRQMMRGPKDAAGVAPAAMSPGNISNRISDAVEGSGRALSERLFSPEEIANLRDYRDLMDTARTANKQNPSGTAYVNDMLRKGMSKFKALSWIMSDEAKALSDARSATSGVLPSRVRPVTDMPIGQLRRMVAPVAGGEAGQQGR